MVDAVGANAGPVEIDVNSSNEYFLSIKWTFIVHLPWNSALFIPINGRNISIHVSNGDFNFKLQDS